MATVTYQSFIEKHQNRCLHSKFHVASLMLSATFRSNLLRLNLVDCSWCWKIPWSLTFHSTTTATSATATATKTHRIKYQNQWWMALSSAVRKVCDLSLWSFIQCRVIFLGVRHITTIVFHNIKNTIGELRQYEQCCASLIQSKDGDWFCSSSCSLIDNTSISNNYHISSVGGACWICIVTKSLQRNALVGHISCIIGLCWANLDGRQDISLNNWSK